MEVTFCVLRYLHPLAAVAEAFQVGVEVVGHIVAFGLHKGNLLFGDDYRFQHLDLLFQVFGEACRIYGVVAVYKLVLHLCTWIVVQYCATHTEFIEVVVGEMFDNLFHIFFLCV